MQRIVDLACHVQDRSIPGGFDNAQNAGTAVGQGGVSKRRNVREGPSLVNQARSEFVTHVLWANERAGALIMVLIIVCVLSVVAASMLLTTTGRYHTTLQSASWQEAIVGAEAGVDLAMVELRKRATLGPSQSFLDRTAVIKSTGGAPPAAYWTTSGPAGNYANYGHALSSDATPYLLTFASHKGEGNTVLLARVYIDVPGSDTAPGPNNFAVSPDSQINSYISQLDNPSLRDPDGVDRSRWWYRVRSLGIANVSGPPRPNLSVLDNRLRRFSMFTDWRTGQAVATPQVGRLVEVLVQPQMNFRNALMADKQINLNDQDVLIDSYDSSKGVYNKTSNHGSMGNLATNGQLINAGHATVNGDAMTNNGTIKDGDNVTGQQSGNFYQELTPITNGQLNPAWSGVRDDGTLTGNATYKASADSTHPTLVHLDGINLTAGGSRIAVTGPDGSTASTPSYIKIYVQGDIVTKDDSFVSIDPGVVAVIYFTGNMTLQGNGIFNNSMLASHLVLNGLQPAVNADGSFPTRTISINTAQDFEGIVYAPCHDVNLALQAVATDASAQSSASLLSKLQDDQSRAIAEYHQNYAIYQRDMAALGVVIPLLNLVVSTVASDLSTLLPLPRTGQTMSDLNNLQASLNKISQTQIQILSLQGTLTDAQRDDHARGYNGIYGGFVARTISVAQKTHVHYDETLRTAGPVNHYQIVNWFEDHASRNGSASGSGNFWWAKAK